MYADMLSSEIYSRVCILQCSTTGPTRYIAPMYGIAK